MDAAEVVATATRLWKMHQKELPQLERIYAYSRGKRGRASVPDDADAELLELAAISVINVMPLVIDAFVPALTVSGFRSPSSEANLAAWDTWQRERMDARQSEVHRPAVTYGASYLLLRKGPKGAEFLPRTPRRMFAAYVDPTRDEWPQYALETWLDESGPKKLRRGYLYDDTTAYPVTLNGSSASSRLTADPDSEPFSHGFTVVPVVRFVNDRDAEDLLHGEVEPLIVDQQAINATNFDRLVVSRYGAFPQKVITGWAANSESEANRMSAKRVITFEDEEVKATAFPAASVTAYNEILADQIAHVAVKARVQVFALTGEFSNVGAETIALIDSPNQNKLNAKRLSFGESWEQALRLAATLEGSEVPDDAEVLWADTSARSFAQVVDGITKLVAAGVPMKSLLSEVPGLTQQQVDAIVDELDRGEAMSLTQAIVTAARGPVTATEPALEPVAV